MKKAQVGVIPKFKSVFEIVEFLENANKEEEYISQNISLLNKGNIARRIEVTREYKNSLNQLRREIDYSLDLLTRLTTFDAKIFLPFLAEYLSTVEDEPYGVMSDIKEIDGYDAIKAKGIKYYFVTTLSNIEVLIESKRANINKDIYDIGEYLNMLDDEKFICFEKHRKINILDGDVLDEYLENYPKLKRLGYAIANLRLKHPEFKDEEILKTILDVVQTKKRKALI